MLYPLEIWYYARSDRVQREFFLLFAQMQGFSRYRLWRAERRPRQAGRPD